MAKKLILACMALVALAALALPATASASPRLCETEGSVCNTLVAPQKLRAHNVGTVKFGLGAECSTATLTGTLTTNSAGIISWDIETASFTGDGPKGECTSGIVGLVSVHTTIGNGVPWCLIASGSEDKLAIRGNSCSNGSRPITLVLTTEKAGTCKYSRAAGIEGTFTTHTSSSEDAVLTLKPGTGTEFIKEEGGVFCPSTGQWEMSLTVTTDNEPTFTTLYIENV